MKTIQKDRGITLKFNPIQVDTIREPVGERARANKSTAQLRQKVETVYPATSFGNEFQDALGNAPEGQSYEENRMAFVDVNKDATKESVEQTLQGLPDATIYKILTSNWTDLLTSNQKNYGENVLTTDQEKIEYYEKLRNNLIVKNDKDEAVNRKGEVIANPYDGNPEVQYKATFFSKSHREDQDYRSAVTATQSEDSTAERSITQSTPAKIDVEEHQPA